ncbi:MAG: type II secretion system protein, partial [Candidatus Gastranaerophilales bacterium]|nr:type II secretion system protein [Candidatus Gastranaerophilales bacterium]
MLIKNKNKGFTLAEVLITLSIIGVVAALTIPSLVRKYEKQQWITGYKAAFNLVSQTTMMIAAENGGTLNGAFSNEAEMAQAYAAHIKGAHTCIDCRLEDGLDFWAYKCHYLNGQEVDTSGKWSFIYFDNGSAWLMSIFYFPDESVEYVAEGVIL